MHARTHARARAHAHAHAQLCTSQTTVLQRREMLGLPAGDTDPLLDGMSDGEPDFEEPMELVDARARLAQLVHAQGGEALAGARDEGRRPPAAHALRSPSVCQGKGLGLAQMCHTAYSSM